MSGRYEELLLPEQQDKIVDRVTRALKSDNSLSPKALNTLRRVLRIGKPIRGGFKDPIKAPYHTLKQHLNERLELAPAEFARIMAELWAETEPSLRDAVSEQLDGIDPQVLLADEMDEDFWDAQVRLLADKHSDYEEDDILLMTKVCYEHAKLRAGPIAAAEEANGDAGAAGDEAAEVVMDGADGVMSDVLRRLRILPAESSAWSEEVPQLVQALNDLMEAKAEERNRLNKLLDDLKGLQKRIRLGSGVFRARRGQLEH